MRRCRAEHPGFGAEKLVLGIDTCGAAGSVALARLDEQGRLVTLEEATLPGKSYSALLVMTVRELAASGRT